MMQLVHEEIETGGQYTVMGIVYMKNGCCDDRPVVITKARMPGGAISCQCACGGWCTNGHQTATAAVLEYKYMTERERGIWDAAKLESKIRELERVISGVELWE